MNPHQISLETAQKLASTLNIPIEQIMHMPKHILVQKMAEAEKKKDDKE
ncbi:MULTISPECIES: YycC family protein [Bacillaceae]|nr:MULTISPECIES: YycC family protein [Bacillaceae]MDX8359657.1 YycC family protein [Cytobacillus sp. IB215316]MDX8364299.1 YycC family protein [Cytobacillus sp. IB215665]